MNIFTEKIKMRRTEKYLLLASIFLVCVIIGAACNMRATTTNGGRMPVQHYVSFEDTDHFTFEEPQEVNNSHLTDIYHVGRLFFSIGDIFVIGGITGYGFCMLLFLIVKIKERKNERPKKNK